MNRTNLQLPFLFIVFLVLQVWVFQRITLFDTAFCFFYIGFILFLPIETSAVLLLLLGFFIGLSVDLFQSSGAIHASATLLLAFVRNKWITVLTPPGGYQADVRNTYTNLGFSWLLTYLTPLVLLHSMALFFIEAGGFYLAGLSLMKAIFSALFTIILILLYHFIFQVDR